MSQRIQTLAHAPWPLIQIEYPRLDAAARALVARCTNELVRDPQVQRAGSFADTHAASGVECGWAPGRTLWFEDHRAIELVTDPMARGYEYRSLGLAGDGDFLLLSRAQDNTFERYFSETLKLGSPRVIQLQVEPTSDASLSTACLSDPRAYRQLVDAARVDGSFNVVPYLSTGHVWQLARRIANDAQVPVRVAAAVAPLARATNDKLWFAALVRNLLGGNALPTTFSAYSPAAAAATLARLAKEHGRVVIKTPASAGARGNFVIDSSEVRGRSLHEIRARIVAALHEVEWSGPWPILTGVWETAALASPSAQLWIPNKDQGLPVLEGIYSQRLTGSGGIFIGASDALTLPSACIEQITREAMLLAMVFQQIGYVGRASFDALLVGENAERARLHWIESNARWGGVSIPMSAMRRLGLYPPDHHMVIATAPLHLATSFAQVLDISEQFLWRPGRHSGIVWLTPPYPARKVLDFVAIAPTEGAATQLVDDTRKAFSASGIYN